MDIAVEINVFGEAFWVPIDTAATSVWVDKSWFISRGGIIHGKPDEALSADGSRIKAAGRGTLRFLLWGDVFTEPVRVMDNLPDTILIGRNFWRKQGLALSLCSNIGSIISNGRRISGPICSPHAKSIKNETIKAVIEDDDVDRYLKEELDVTEFSAHESMRYRLRDLLWRRRDVFKGMGCFSNIMHHINLKEGSTPVCQPLRRRSPKEEDAERAAMKRLLDMGVLEPSSSPWASNNVMVPKKDGGMRVTTDFRVLNNLTITDSYPMEDVRVILNWLGSKRIFSTFDLKDGFYHVALTPESKPLTAIRTVVGLLQYRRLPQGVKNAPGTFQRIVNMMLGDRKGRDVMAFVDDTSVGSETEEEHLKSLGTLFETLLKFNVRLKLSKCHFGVRKVEILGHLVSSTGLQPSEKHVEAIKQLVEPASGDELMRFLGLANYFSDFVDHFADTARPLYKVLVGTGFSKKRKHGQKLKIHDWTERWKDEQRLAWKSIKEALSEPTSLVAPIRGSPKKVMTDASSFGLGGVLLQVGNDGKWRPVAYTSKTLKKSELAYTVTEKECYAVVHALRRWRHHLLGEKFKVVSDHLALKWLLSLKDPRERLARWVLDVQEFDFETVYEKGSNLVVPDALSRDAVRKPLCQRCYGSMDNVPEEITDQFGENVRSISEVRIVASSLSPETVRTAQIREFGDLPAAAAVDLRKIVDEEGVLRIAMDGDIAVVVPQELKNTVMKHVHGTSLTGHYRARRTFARMRGRFWWKGWMQDVANFLKSCIPCIASSDSKPGRQAPMTVTHPRRRFSVVAVDVQTITPRTNSKNIKIVAMVDTFTRFARAVAIPDERADTVAAAIIDHWISVFGPMEALLSDRGPNFIGSIIDSLAARLGIDRLVSYPLHPQANGAVERWNRTLTRDLASFVCTGSSDWDEHVSLACFRYNTGICEATGMTPYRAMFGVDAFEAWETVDMDFDDGEPDSLAERLARLHKDLVGKSKQARTQAAKNYDRVMQEVKYAPGDRVLMWSTEIESQEGKKVIKPWVGPYKIVRALGRVGYEIISEVGSRTARVHVNRLRKIGPGATESGNPKDGVFPDSLRLLNKIRGTKIMTCPTSGTTERWFKVQIGGRRSPRWTKESDLPDAVVKLYDTAVPAEVRSSQTEQVATVRTLPNAALIALEEYSQKQESNDTHILLHH